MITIPLLEIGDVPYPDVDKPVVAWLPGGEVVQFDTLEEAQAEMREEWVKGNAEARYAEFWVLQDGTWTRVIPKEV